MKQNNGALNYGEVNVNEIQKKDGDSKLSLITKPGGNLFKPQVTIYMNIRKSQNGVNEKSFDMVLNYLSGQNKFIKERTEYIQNSKKEICSDEDMKLRKS